MSLVCTLVQEHSFLPSHFLLSLPSLAATHSEWKRLSCSVSEDLLLWVFVMLSSLKIRWTDHTCAQHLTNILPGCSPVILCGSKISGQLWPFTYFLYLCLLSQLFFFLSLSQAFWGTSIWTLSYKIFVCQYEGAVCPVSQWMLICFKSPVLFLTANRYRAEKIDNVLSDFQ